MTLPPQEYRLAEQRINRARRRLFLPLTMLVLLVPLAARMEDVSSDASIAPGPPLHGKLAVAFALDGVLPGLAVNAALVALFPSWRIQRIALPLVAALTLIGWVAWSVFDLSGTFSDHPLSDRRSFVLAAGPLGFVTVTALIFLVARARRLAAPRE